MSKILSALREHAARRPDGIVIRSIEGVVTYSQMIAAIDELVAELKARKAKVVALMLDNTPAWTAIDLACMQAKVTLVPIPLFFSDSQRRHAVQDARVDTILTNQAHRFDILYEGGDAAVERLESVRILDREIEWMRPPNVQPSGDLDGIAKVTYTSGTTGQPKGVKLTESAMELVVSSCNAAIGMTAQSRPLALVPLSVLMENLLGFHNAILAGAEYVVVPMPALGFRGSAQMDPTATLDTLRSFEASQVICTPQVLQNLVVALEGGAPRLSHMKFMGLGGAPAPKKLIERAVAQGLPIQEGWGLSEAGSVVTLNVPNDNRVGSVGRPLPHAKVRIGEDGELFVSGPSLLSGYAGDPAPREAGEWLATGDLGEFDADGYLHITGRKKSVIINSYGRNLSPDWVEGEMTLRPEIGQVLVYGDSRPHLVGVVVSAADDATIARVIEDVNWELPDYARIRQWIRADAPFSLLNDQLTGSGKPRRDVIHKAYAERLDQLYELPI